MRFGVVDRPGVLGQLMTILGARSVSIEQVIQDTKRGGAAPGDPVSVVVLTHEAREGDVRAALAAIDELAIVKNPARVIRIVG
jgi:homoserine dehydrogenase